MEAAIPILLASLGLACHLGCRRQVRHADVARNAFLGLAALFAVVFLGRYASAASVRPLVDTALERNRSLADLEAQAAALEHRIERAGTWADPRFTVSYRNVPVDSFALGRDPMSMLHFQLSQAIPMPAKTAAREAVAVSAGETKRLELEERKNLLRAEIKRAYFELWKARQLYALTTSHVELVAQLLDAVRIKYEVGRASQHDLLRLQVLHNKLSDDRHDFRRRDRELTAAINAALHRDVTTAVETPAELEVVEPADSLESLRTAAAQHRPALAQMKSASRTALLKSELASVEAVPDVTFSAGYGFRQAIGTNPGKDLVTVGLGVSLPLFPSARYGSEAAAQSEQSHAVEARRAALGDSIARDLEATLSRWQRAAQKEETYRTSLVPDAHRALDATFAAYQVDRAGFSSLFDAEVDLLTFEKTIRTAVADSHIARATVEMLIGKELP